MTNKERIKNLLAEHYVCCDTCEYHIEDERDDISCSKTQNKIDCFGDYVGQLNKIHWVNGEIWTAKYSNNYLLWEKKEEEIIINYFREKDFEI